MINILIKLLHILIFSNICFIIVVIALIIVIILLISNKINDVINNKIAIPKDTSFIWKNKYIGDNRQ